MFKSNLQDKYPVPTSFLTNAIKKNKLANSYVFVGNDINEIQELVINLAKILNCEKNKNSNPCESCISCKWLEKNQHPHALIQIAVTEEKTKKEQIKIDLIRELLSNLRISSSYFKVVFIKNSDLISFPQESGNLLLKIVEEPPERVLFIFANSTKNDIMPTIVSRSQVVYLSKKFTSIKEIFDLETISENLSNTLLSAKQLNEYLNENKIILKNYLIHVVLKNYEKLKNQNSKDFSVHYENLLYAFQKSKAFMQQRIVLEDLFLGISF